MPKNQENQSSQSSQSGYVCPFCSSQIEKNIMECPFCGSRFMGDTKWPDKKPIIDEELALREGKYIDQSVSRYGLSRKPLNESLKEFGTNREQFDEALSALHTDTPISPYALASTFLSEYQEVKTSRTRRAIAYIRS
jgi:DNA-directed RNA polymerase subunit RPC12/RpoP